MIPLKRRLATLAVPALAVISLSACGGGPGGDAPEDASAEDFCTTFTEASTGGEDADAAHDFADKLAETGTPEELDGDAREGFELFVDKLSDISDDELQDNQDLDDVFEGDDADKVRAFVTQSGEICAEELAPSDSSS